MKSKDLSVLSSDEFSSLFFYRVVINKSIYSTLILFNDSKYISHSIDSMHKLQSIKLLTMSVSLHTETGLHCLTIQVLNTRVCFIVLLTDGNIMAILTESFS